VKNNTPVTVVVWTKACLLRHWLWVLFQLGGRICIIFYVFVILQS